MGDDPFSLETRVLGFVAAALLLGGGVLLSRGTAWMFALGIPLPAKTERVEVALPPGIEGDLDDDLDRLHTFDLDDYCSAFWLSANRIGLLYWAVSFGARNTLKIRAIRGVGVLATGIVDIQREATHTTFRWRPVIRLGPLALLGALVGMLRVSFGPDYPVLPALAIWGLMYLVLLLWTLRKLPGMYEGVSAQLVARAKDSPPSG